MVRGPVRKQSMDPVRSGGPRTAGQSFRVTWSLLNNISHMEIDRLEIDHDWTLWKKKC